MKVIVRFTSGRESVYAKALDCYIKEGFVHVVTTWRNNIKVWSFNKDNVDEIQTYGGKNDC